METGTRAKPFPILAAFLGAVVLGTIAGLTSGAMPPLPAKVVLGVTIPLLFLTWLAAIPATSRIRAAAPRPGGRPLEASPSEDDLERASEVDRVHGWRNARLLALGVAEDTAMMLAAHRTFSVHELERLVAAGCPLGTALRIVWPA